MAFTYLDDISNIDNDAPFPRIRWDPRAIFKNLKPTNIILEDKCEEIPILVLADSIVLGVGRRKISQSRHEVGSSIFVVLFEEVGRKAHALIQDLLNQ